MEITRKLYGSFRDVAKIITATEIKDDITFECSEIVRVYKPLWKQGDHIFSFFKVFHDGWMAIRISLPLRNWISFLGKPECEETSINSNSQYKQVSRDTPEHKLYNPPHFIHMRH